MDFSPEMKAKLEETKKLLISNEKESYEISYGSKTPEEAVQKFLRKTINEPEVSKNPYIFTQKENLEVQYPNVYGSGTSLDVTPIEDYQYLVEKLTRIGYEKIYTKVKPLKNNIKFEIVFQKPRVFKKLIGLKPYVIVKYGSKSIEIDEIKTVFKVGNLYKIGVIAP